MKRIRLIILTILLCLLCVVVLMVFWRDRIPTETPPASTEDAEQTDPILIYPITDIVNRNDYLTFKIEELTYSKAIPQGFATEDIMGLGMVTTDEHGTLLLFTPQYGIFSADYLKRLGYTQPHILLKGENL